MPARVHLRLRFQNLGKPRTAGLCGRAARMSDCGPLSCTKIERPSPLEKPFCKVQLFAQNRSRNYRQKVTATTLFQTASYSDFQLLAQMAHVRFHRRKWVHTRPCSKDRTQRHTRRNTGRFGWGVVSLPSDRFACFGNPARPGVRTANFAAFGSWSGGALEERRKPSGQRCAHACRCSAGVAAPLGCAVLMPLFVQYDLEGWKDLTKRSGRVTITRNNRTTSRLALVWEPLRAVK